MENSFNDVFDQISADDTIFHIQIAPIKKPIAKLQKEVVDFSVRKPCLLGDNFFFGVLHVLAIGQPFKFQ